MGPHPDFEAVVRKVNTLVQELTNLMLNLDDANFDKITANVLDVNELSAITANMGKLISGEIYGAYIATSEGVYPLAEMSNTSDLFGAYSSAAKYIQMKALEGTTGTPAMIFRDASISLTAQFYIDNINNEFNIGSTKTIQISALPGGDIKLNGNNVTVNGVNVNSGLGSNMAFDPTTRNLKLFAPNGNTIATVNIP